VYAAPPERPTESIATVAVPLKTQLGVTPSEKAQDTKEE
jgi:hypothetical protein